ncbi:hypothetical protein C8R41DRAFT_783168 [Lentinula lateritia]|uniref:Uncharacterized protein n=1 Tax=Lentinula lateritia TaxID=40482 RepID=A0ABQ8V0V8_9AGAR|nr:hypothetical protein C8R41DRAFT_783168 [Lentinula lateritia]
MSSTQGEATSVTKGKRFTPLVASIKTANLASTKTSVFSEEEDLVHSHAGPPLTTSLAIPIASSFSSHEIAVPIASTFSSRETAILSTTRSSVTIHADAKSTSRTRTYAAFAPPSAISSARLRALKVATSSPIVRKASSIPDITLEVNSPTSLSLYHLDFPMSIPIVLNRISMPPALAQRKQVARFAVILSQIAIQDLSNCMLVSRMFRYAIYLSASTRLARNFSGYRLNRIIHRLPANMMNMWPYLLQRQGEEKFRRRVFEESFLGRVFSGSSVIAPRLWASPDNDKQISLKSMDNRFLMTRLFFTVSVGGGQSVNDWLNGMIADAREIIKGEVWCIDVLQTSKELETFYVVESTCEVVGFAPSPSKAEGPLPMKMRADWSSYINQRSSIIPPLQLITNSPGKQLDPTRSLSSIPATSLMDQLSCMNHEEFTKGISKLWLKKVQIQQEVGVAKRVVAERYILASVVENSVSGRYKTSTEMAHDFAGVRTELGDRKKLKFKLNLFLPAHHHVESVHFTTAQGRPLHPALAVVQTPAREYYVLRDNGMQVGCEEDGVARVWMTILGCAINGERV